MLGITNAKGSKPEVARLLVSIDSGSTVVATNGSKTKSLEYTLVEGTYFYVCKIGSKDFGEWTITATKGTDEATETVTVSSGADYRVDMMYLEIVTWSAGTDEQIVKMLQAHYDGKIDIHDYWSVGDERSVSLGAIASSGTANGVSWSVGESHSAQNVTLVLMHSGLYELTEGGTCSFVVGQKNCLSESGYMNISGTNVGSWGSCARRLWCNGGYWNAIPSTLRPIFKQFKTTTAGNSTGIVQLQTVDDYFALFAEKEIQNPLNNSVSAEYNALSYITYYNSTSRRTKNYDYWLRSPASGYTDRFVYAYFYGSGTSVQRAYGGLFFAPFGCI